MQVGEPAGILFLVNQNIVRLPGAETMPPDLHRAVVVVELDVEKTLAVRAPEHPAVGLLDEIVAVFPALPIAHADRKIFRALCVGAPGLQPMVRRVPAAAELEVFVACRELVAVKHNRDVAAVPWRAAEHFVLAALAKPA